MDGLGHGYDAFVERLVSDFKTSNVSTKGSDDNGGYPPRPSSNYMGFNPPNSFNNNRDSSSSSPSASSMKNALEMGPRQHDANLPHMSNQGAGSASDMNLVAEIAPRHRGHRRAHSEIAFRLPDDDLSLENEPNLAEASAISDETSDDLFSMYVDLDKINSHSVTSSSILEIPTQLTPSTSHHMRSASFDRVIETSSITSGGGSSGILPTRPSKPRHHHSNSMDGSMQDLFVSSDLFEAKKAMPADKLAELALMDPKRAKRILANRQSAARSKERKVRYICELERRVQTLQVEACTLTAQITMLQRDTSGLTTENNELRLRLQSMEEQAQLRDALSDALREEIQRLKVATTLSNTSNGDMMIPAGSTQTHNQQLHLQQRHYGFTTQTQSPKGHPSSTSFSPANIMTD